MPTAPALDEPVRALIQLAVREDLGGLPDTHGDDVRSMESMDRTVALCIPPELFATGTIVARNFGIISGTFLIAEILKYYDSRFHCRIMIADGRGVASGDIVAHITGPAGALLSAERVVLNFIGRLSGIATLTSQYVQAAATGSAVHGPVVCDTRKTTPGWRTLEKYAVRCGGGVNHRMGLYDGVMLKDNHIAAWRRQHGSAASLADLTRNVRAKLPTSIPLWLEVDTLAQLKEALPGAADIILLDNMTLDQMRQAVYLRDEFHCGGPPLLEASGGVTLATIAAIAATRVDRISVGALTHSAPCLDLAMEIPANE